MTSRTDRLPAVAIVTGGSGWEGQEVVRGLTRWGWPSVIAYLEQQPRVDEAVAEIVDAGRTAVAVRSDLTDDLDVQRLFAESVAVFGGVDVVVHTTMDDAARLYHHAARYVRSHGMIVTTSSAASVAPPVAARLRERGITVERATPREVLAVLDRWRRQSARRG